MHNRNTLWGSDALRPKRAVVLLRNNPEEHTGATNTINDSDSIAVRRWATTRHDQAGVPLLDRKSAALAEGKRAVGRERLHWFVDWCPQRCCC